MSRLRRVNLSTGRVSEAPFGQIYALGVGLFMERVYALPAESKHFHLFTRDSDIKGHQAYSAGKSGDPDAALQLIEDLAFDFVTYVRRAVEWGK